MNLNQTDRLLELADLMDAYHKGQLDARQQAELEARLMTDVSLKRMLDSFAEKEKVLADLKQMVGFDTERSLAEFHKKQVASKELKLWPRIVVAAAAVVVMVFGIWFYNASDFGGINQTRDISPGSNKATLTLTNGHKIPLNTAKSGIIIDASKLIYTDGALLQQEADAGLNENNLMEINTPKGGQYQLTLADGTKVWLNAASSLKFPKTFSDQSTRVVELNGEAYFEVAKDKKRPFRVMSNGQEVEVLGTHFNINSYTDEGQTKTTLLEGSVKVNETLLKPDQQSVLYNGQITVHDINSAQAVAWKNGLFTFENASIETVMRQISRWYDIEVEYTGKTSGRVFNGEVYKNMSLTKVLEVLKLSKVNYKIEGRKIIVTR